MNSFSAEYWISKLNLQAHPEGGFYKETYRSIDTIKTENGERNISTAIYFLLDGKHKSHLHKIKSDELWFFHEGDALEIIVLDERGLTTIDLGKDLEHQQSPQAIIPAGSWFGARVKNGKGYALVSCTVAPGFDFNDFELANKETLTNLFPHYKSVIEEMSL